jgi:hypothetical protein
MPRDGAIIFGDLIGKLDACDAIAPADMNLRFFVDSVALE